MPDTDPNRSLFEEACEIFPGGVNTSLRYLDPPIIVTRARGAVLTDAAGRELVDYSGAAGPIILGHAYEPVNRRVSEILGRIDLVGTGTTDVEIALGRKIKELIPGAEKVLFCNSGSEATLQAIRVARAVTGRPKIVKFQGSYHGWHDYVCRNVASPPEKLGKLDPASAGVLPEALENTLVCRFNDLGDVERVLSRHRGEIAGMILEPVQHYSGCILPQDGFLQGLRSMTRDHGIVLIFDEIVTGFRHGLGGYQKLAGVTPDLTALGKAMANGFPIAALCGKAAVMDRFNTNPAGDVLFAGTYNAHPVGCAAALATIEILEREPVHEHLFRLGEKARKGLREICARLGIPAAVEGFGSIFLTYFMEGTPHHYEDVLRNDAERFVAYRRGLLERGIFKVPKNLRRSHLSFSHTDRHIDDLLNAAEDVLRRAAPSRSIARPSRVR